MANISGTLRGANLSGADLRGADIRDADLTDAVLDGVKLANAKVVGATLNPIHRQLVQTMKNSGTAQVALPTVAHPRPWWQFWS